MAQPNPQTLSGDLITYIQASELFSRLDASVLQKLNAEVKHLVVKKDQLLFRQGDPSDAMYLVISGNLEVSITHDDGKETIVGQVGPGKPVGEMQILAGGERTANVYAIDDAALVKIPKSVFERLSKDAPQAIEQMAGIIRRRLKHNQLAIMLPKIFGALSEEALKAIESELEWVELKQGDLLFKQGDPGDRFYILVAGRLSAFTRDADGQEHLIGEVARGESVGEMGVLTDEQRAANVRAVRDSELVKFSKAAFDRITDQHPQVLRYISRLVINRFRQQIRQTRNDEEGVCIAIVPGSSGVPTAEFVRLLALALSKYGPVLKLDGSRVDRLMGTPGISQASRQDSSGIRIATWLDDQEAKFRFILYETNPDSTEWTQQCLRRADHILAVNWSDGDPKPAAIETQLLDAKGLFTFAARSLVLLHKDSTRPPTATAQWLQTRPGTNHYHLRWEQSTDMDRLARILSGKAVGLVLNGSGARCFAHIGVIRALTEAEIPIDFIGGVSMSSIIAAQYALGWSNDRMLSIMEEITGDIMDYTLPMVALTRGRQFAQNLARTFAATAIEDLWLPYFSISANLTRAKMVNHRQGDLKTTLYACSMPPVVGPPLVQDGDLLIDGFILNHTPVDQMKTFSHGGLVIVSEAMSSIDLTQNSPYGADGLSGWRVLAGKMKLAGSLDLPNIAEIVMRSHELSSLLNRKKVRDAADLYLCPPVEEFAQFNYSVGAVIADVGYRDSLPKIREWRKMLSK